MDKRNQPLEYDPDFKGPLSKRSCTDIPCLLLFFVFLITWAGVACYAFLKGDLDRLLVPTDSDGLKCGVDSEVQHEPYLVFLDITECAKYDVRLHGCKTPQICVKQCPTEDFDFLADSCNSSSLATIRSQLICDCLIQKDQLSCNDIQTHIDRGQCAKYYRKSVPFSKRCLPDLKIRQNNSQSMIDAVANIELSIGTGQMVVEDIMESRPLVIGLLVASLLASLIFITMLRWIAKPMVWISILGAIATLCCGIYYSYEQYQSEETWLPILIILSIALVVLLLVVLILCGRIAIAIVLIKEGSKAVTAIFATVFFPIIPWVLHILVTVFAITVGLYLASIGYPKDIPKEVGYFHAINVVEFFWGICFISAFGEMVLAFTFATWYWTFRKKDLRFFVLTTGFLRTVRYHLGTLAFGSFIIAICKIVRVMLELTNHRSQGNPVVRVVCSLLNCCFRWLESFLKFLNTNAYIMCAIHGKNFCSSAKDAFSLLARNVLRVIVLDKVTGFLFFLSKLLLACGMAAITFSIFDSGITKQLHYPFVPAILVFVGTYVIASVFFSVYSVAVDTLFLCFLEDCERNDGTPEKPYYMSRSLMKILIKK